MFKVRFFGGLPWYIVQPVLYRYLPSQKWVDAFFATGELWLSSFSEFHAHQDEHGSHWLEGGVQFESDYRLADGRFSHLWVRSDYGRDAYVLCGSMSDDPDIARKFKAGGCIAIQDTTGFAKAVSRHIPGFVGGSEGPCIYASGRSVKRDFDLLPVDEPGADEPPSDELQAWLRDRLREYPYYVKASSFAYQLEYRIVWLTDREVDGHIVIRVPEARAHCQMTKPL
jgi:hypothetical protein